MVIISLSFFSFYNSVLGSVQYGSYCIIHIAPPPPGVGIIALLKRTLHKDCVVMVKQFRPPLGCYTLEFPAGQTSFVMYNFPTFLALIFGCMTHFVSVTFDLKNISFIWDSGLIDEGESAEITALRELKEETGFKGEVVGVTPGITAHTIHI